MWMSFILLINQPNPSVREGKCLKDTNAIPAGCKNSQSSRFTSTIIKNSLHFTIFFWHYGFLQTPHLIHMTQTHTNTDWHLVFYWSASGRIGVKVLSHNASPSLYHTPHKRAHKGWLFDEINYCGLFFTLHGPFVRRGRAASIWPDNT